MRPITTHEVMELLKEINAEIFRSYHLFPAKINNPHEAYGILSEELDEFFDHVKTKDGQRDLSAMNKELIQLAAMSLRTIIDLTPMPKEAA